MSADAGFGSLEPLSAAPSRRALLAGSGGFGLLALAGLLGRPRPASAGAGALAGGAVEGRMLTNDLHATLLALMGIDHERLTYPYAGRDFRLTDVAGRVAYDIFA